MATKKTAPAAEPEVAAEIAEEVKEPRQEAEAKTEWDEMVEMIIPRKSKGDDQSYYVCVNDRRYLIPANGKMQKLPKPIAEVLKDSLDAESAAEDLADRIERGETV